MLIKYEKELNFYNFKRGSWINIRKILSYTILIILEGTMYLAIIFQNHWFDGKHNAKLRIVN